MVERLILLLLTGLLACMVSCSGMIDETMLNGELEEGTWDTSEWERAAWK